MKKIFICSRLRGNVLENQERCKEYCISVLKKGFIPIAPHIYFTQFLNDQSSFERCKGIECGLELLKICDEIWVFGAEDMSEGMIKEVELATELNIPIIKFDIEMKKLDE